MMPNNAISVIPQVAPFLYPDSLRTGLLEDWEDGGVGIQDPSQGLYGYRWKCFANSEGIWLQRDGLAAQLWIAAPGAVREVAFAFDHNMRPVVSYVLDTAVVKLLWFDTLSSQYTTTDYGTSIRNPRLSLDDKRGTQSQASDVIFAYIKGANLCFRQQRERYTVERIIHPDVDQSQKLRNIGMSSNNRFRFQIL